MYATALWLGLLLSTAAAGSASGQSVPAPGDAMPMADYLGLLEQIAPAARRGAEIYVHAYRERCGRHLTTGELRHAMANGRGNPALMAMIRAAQMRDDQALTVLATGLRCGVNQ